MREGEIAPGTANGEPATVVSAPPVPTLNTVTVLLSCALTKSRLSSGLKTATLEFAPGPLKGDPVIRDNVPVRPMSKTSTREFATPLSATNNCLLEQLQSRPVAPESGVGDPATGVSAPAPEILKTNMAGTEETARNLPSAVTLALFNGCVAPVGNGEPGTGLRAPFAATLNTLIVIEAPLATIRNWSSGVVVQDIH